MVSFTRSNTPPIGIDLGSRSVKLVQFNAGQTELVDAARWDLPTGVHSDLERHWAEALRRAREGKNFRGKKAVLCVGAGDLHVQNIRVPKGSPDELARNVLKETQGRIPFPAADLELRYFEAADVRQGETLLREVIVLACNRTQLERKLAAVEAAGLTPAGVDAEPAAVLRCYASQWRREADSEQRLLFVSFGATRTGIIIARGPAPLFIKYVDIGGAHLDEAVAKGLKMTVAEASNLRRHNGDRRADQQDAEVRRAVAGAVRPVLEKLSSELSLCIRYHSVTFRGQPLARLILTGGEATQALADLLSERVDVPVELGDPLRAWQARVSALRMGQWDVAAGLALKQAPRAVKP